MSCFRFVAANGQALIAALLLASVFVAGSRETEARVVYECTEVLVRLNIADVCDAGDCDHPDCDCTPFYDWVTECEWVWVEEPDPVTTTEAKGLSTGGGAGNGEDPLTAPGGLPCPDDRQPGKGAGTDPVDLGSGEYSLEVEDLRVSGRGDDFIWSRIYKSRFAIQSAIGMQWDFSYNIYLENLLGDTVRLHDGRGSRTVLHPVNGAPSDPSRWRNVRSPLELVRDSSSALALRFPTGGTWRFNDFSHATAPGRIIESRDRSDNALIFQYDNEGRLEIITDTVGRSYTLAYNADGFVSTLTDFSGRVITYNYYEDGDAGGQHGDLKSVTTPAISGTPHGNDFPNGRTTTYTYATNQPFEELEHNLLTITDARANDPGDPRHGSGPWLINEYGASDSDLSFDRVIRQTWGGGIVDVTYERLPDDDPLEPGGVVTMVNDRLGNVREIYFNGVNDPEVGLVLPPGLVRERHYTGYAHPSTPTTRNTNRPDPLLKRRLEDPEFFETTYENDVFGNTFRVTNPTGSSRLIERAFARRDDVEWGKRSAITAIKRQVTPGWPTSPDGEIVEQMEYEGVGLFGCGCADYITKHVDGNGNETLFEFDDGGNKTKITHRDPTVVEDFEYNSHGQLTAHVHPPNDAGVRRRDEYTYHDSGNGAGQIKEIIVDALGLALTSFNEYDEWGNLASIMDPRGNTAEREYNAVGELIRETSRPVSSGGVRYEKSYFYDANGNLFKELRDNVDAEGLIDSSNPHWERRLGYGDLNELKVLEEETTAGIFATTEFSHDADRNVVLIKHGEAVAGNQPANVVKRVIDERGRVFEVTRAPDTPESSTTRYRYDGNGNLVFREDGIQADGTGARATTWERDAYNRLTAMTDAMGNRREYGHDAIGNVTHELLLGEVDDVSGSASNVRLAEIWREFNPNGLLKVERTMHFDARTGAPIGDGERTRTFAYTAAADLQAILDDRGNETRYWYDSARRLRMVRDADGNVREYTRDENGNARVIKDTHVGAVDGVKVYTKQLEHDGLNRLIRVEDDLQNVRQQAHDSSGNLGYEVDARGNVTRSKYDGMSQLLETRREMRQGGTGSGWLLNELVTRQSWDLSGRLASRTDDNDNVTTYSWDPLGRLRELERADGSSREFTYRGDDVVKTILDERGNLTTFQSDDLGRVTRADLTIVGAGVSTAVTFEEFERDGFGQIRKAENDHSVVERAFDSLGNLIADEVIGLTATAVFDAEGGRLGLNYPSGRQLSYVPDELGRIATIRESGSDLSTYWYAGPSRRSRRVDSNGTGWDTYYDAAGRAETTLHGHATGPVHYVVDYEWDGDGNKTLRHGRSGVTQTFQYDSASRLIDSQWSHPVDGVQSVAYLLDGVGNREVVTGGPDPGIYSMSSTAPDPADHQVNQYTTVPFGTLTHDAGGNLSSITEVGGGVRHLTFDFGNRLVRHEDASTGQVVEFDHDALGRRIRKRVNGFETRFGYYGQGVVEEQDDLGSVTTYVHGEFVDEVVQMRRQGVDYFLRGDDQNSVTTVTNASGVVVERYRYQDYGKPLIYDANWTERPASTIGNSYLFTGRRYDAEIGMYYYRTRYLWPRLGRFISRDSIGFWGDAANHGNPLTYVGNNPWSRIDPSGREGEEKNGLSAFLRGYREGVGDGAAGFLGEFWDALVQLWNAAENPSEFFGEMKAGFSAMANLAQQGEFGEILGSMYPEVSQLLTCWSGASDASRAHMLAVVRTKYGAEIALAIVTAGAGLAVGTAKVATKAVDALKKALRKPRGGGGGVKPYEVGLVDDLRARSIPGDELDIHHVGQAHPMEQLAPGYDRATAPGIAVPRAEHASIPTTRGPATGTARQQLAKDIRDMRNYTNAPNSNLQALIELNKRTYVEAFTK